MCWCTTTVSILAATAPIWASGVARCASELRTAAAVVARCSVGISSWRELKYLGMVFRGASIVGQADLATKAALVLGPGGFASRLDFWEDDVCGGQCSGSNGHERCDLHVVTCRVHLLQPKEGFVVYGVAAVSLRSSEGVTL